MQALSLRAGGRAVHPISWYDRFRSGGPEALEDKPPKPDRVWNRITDDIRQRVVMMAFEQPELSPRELATRFTDTNSYYVSKSSVYRLLKAHDLIGSPAFIVIKAADEFKDKTTAPNQLWQTDLRPNHPSGTRKDQTRHHQTATIETSVESRLNSNPNEPEPPSLNNSDCPKPSDDGQATQPVTSAPDQ